MNPRTVSQRVGVLFGFGLVFFGLLFAGQAIAQERLPAAPLGVDVPLGTSFTYQGQLKDSSGNPVTDTCNFRFILYDAEIGGAQMGPVLDIPRSVTGGYFTVALDFGSGVFTGSARWMEVAVKCSGDAGYTGLDPRQPLTAAPYALNTDLLDGLQASDFASTGHTHAGVYALLSHVHAGEDITSGTVADARIAASLARDSEIWPTVLASDGSGSTLDADLLDGYQATAFANTSHIHWGQSWSGSGIGLNLSGGIIGLSGSGSLYGVHGDTTSTAGYGVLGTAASTTGTNYGVYGLSYSTSGRGVYGLADANDGTNYGVYGISNSTAGYGVYGIAPNYGVWGESNNVGVWGNSSATNGYGVVGTNYATTGSTRGVYGSSNSADGYGVYGTSPHYGVYGNASYIGVRGYTDSTTGMGVYGSADSNTGTNYGVYGYSDSTSGRGVYGVATSDTGTNYGVRGRTDSPDGWAGWFYSTVGNGMHISTPAGKTGLEVAGGTKSAVVRTDDGSRLLYSEESTEVWFTDYGVGQLQLGMAVIAIDPLFAQTVNLNVPYLVFLTPMGDCGLYVAEKTTASFTVRALDGKTCSLDFDYRIVARRLGYEDDRLEPAPWADTDPNLYPENAALFDEDLPVMTEPPQPAEELPLPPEPQP